MGETRPARTQTTVGVDVIAVAAVTAGLLWLALRNLARNPFRG